MAGHHNVDYEVNATVHNARDWYEQSILFYNISYLFHPSACQFPIYFADNLHLISTI